MVRPPRLTFPWVLALVVVACGGGASPSPESSTATVAPSQPIYEPSSTGSPPEPTATPDVAVPPAVGHSVTCHDEETVCEIHLVRDSIEPVGWPIVLDGPCRELRTGAGGFAYVGCAPAEGATIHVIDLDGRPVDGWPVRAGGTFASVSWQDFGLGCGVGRSAIEIGLDNTVYAAISEGSVAALHVLESDGTPRAGWPQPFPGDAPQQDGYGGDGCRGFAVGGDDTVLAWGYQDIVRELPLGARRTEFTIWSANGVVRPGWPRGSVGAASGPVRDVDGGITYVSASGRVWSHDELGEIRLGWPYELAAPAAPYLGADGRLVIVAPSWEVPDRLVILDRDGRAVTGGPIALPGPAETICIFGDTPCSGMTYPAIASDGTIYLSLAPEGSGSAGTLVAIGADGAIVDGWPVDLALRTRVLDLSVDANGRLVARGVVCGADYCGSDDSVPTILIFGPDGELLDQQFEA